MPRRLAVLGLSIWPGLPQIWSGQVLLGTLLASFFAVSLNLAIIAQRLWTEWLRPPLPGFISAFAATTWLLSLVYSLWWAWQYNPARHQVDIDRLYREATNAYLQGRWDDARRHLEELLVLNEADADALMQLGTLYLRTNRVDDARHAFRQCLDLEGGTKWKWEIEEALRANQPGRK